jgi:hypothetical protein
MEKIDGLKNEHQNIFWNDSSLLSDILKDNYELGHGLAPNLNDKRAFMPFVYTLNAIRMKSFTL